MADSTQWWPYHDGDMAHRLRLCGPAAEGIAHRLFRAYHRREQDVPVNDDVLAWMAQVDIDTFRAVRKELATVIDLTGAVMRIPFLDREMEKAKDICEKRSRAAHQRWDRARGGAADGN